MDLEEIADDRGRLARTLAAGVLGVVALCSLRKGKRLRALLAGGGAVALGYQATTESDEMTDLDIDSLGADASSTDEETAEAESADDEFRCAACGEPIVPGQARGPNAAGEIVHEDCDAAA
ncbi:hypothetical protein SAMN06269185_2685 [Natronoarchaeum philippinense]|uniref:DUF2892 domain-containing protein n=1 Tax=Natronoarchaeum philippinense TaxID=558529 RepID=A0A285P3M7_NATPI|nr:hypothetical protein [Natronoarchaeum philippinense]SNZ16058.1 hypothetical protein SAMN06269185_2685 [Natronoarchaeum philippinense]